MVNGHSVSMIHLPGLKHRRHPNTSASAAPVRCALNQALADRCIAICS